MVKPRTQLGTYIQRARKHNKMSQIELARIIGVQEETISRWEHGDTAPKEDYMPGLIAALKVNDSEFRSLYIIHKREDEIGSYLNIIRTKYSRSDEKNRSHIKRVLEAMVNDEELQGMFSYLLKRKIFE